MPFQDYADAFAPGDLEVMTAAFNTVTKSSPRPLTSNEKTTLAQRIMESAADGVVDIGPLTRVALAQLARFEPTLTGGADSDAPSLSSRFLGSRRSTWRGELDYAPQPTLERAEGQKQ